MRMSSLTLPPSVLASPFNLPASRSTTNHEHHLSSRAENAPPTHPTRPTLTTAQHHTHQRYIRILRSRPDPVPHSIAVPDPLRDPRPFLLFYSYSLRVNLHLPQRPRCWAKTLDPGQLAYRDAAVHRVAVGCEAGEAAGDVVCDCAGVSWGEHSGGAGVVTVGVGLERGLGRDWFGRGRADSGMNPEVRLSTREFRGNEQSLLVRLALS